MSITTFIISHFVFGFIAAILSLNSKEFQANLTAAEAKLSEKYGKDIRISRILIVIVYTLAGSLLFAALLKRIIDSVRVRKKPVWTLIDDTGKTIRDDLTFKEAEALSQFMAQVLRLSGVNITGIEVNEDERTFTLKGGDE